MSTEIDRLKEDFDRKTSRLLENHRRELREAEEDFNFKLESANIVNAEELKKQREKFEDALEDEKSTNNVLGESLTLVQNSLIVADRNFSEFKEELSRLKFEHPSINWFWADLPLNNAIEALSESQAEAYRHI